MPGQDVGVERGQVSRGYVYRCARCPFHIVMENSSGTTTRAGADRGARRSGWSKTAERGWCCPQCSPPKPPRKQVTL